ncbi:MAG: hypothetical protein ACFFG0_50145 [Candidatus Thorarchaeota archaeon]
MDFISRTTNFFSKLKESIKSAKGYIKVIAISIIIIIVAAFLLSMENFINENAYTGEEYDLIIERLGATYTLLIKIGIGLFSLAILIGAITDRSLSTELRRGMIIAAGLGVLALVLFEEVIFYLVI